MTCWLIVPTCQSTRAGLQGRGRGVPVTPEKYSTPSRALSHPVNQPAIPAAPLSQHWDFGQITYTLPGSGHPPVKWGKAFISQGCVRMKWDDDDGNGDDSIHHLPCACHMPNSPLNLLPGFIILILILLPLTPWGGFCSHPYVTDEGRWSWRVLRGRSVVWTQVVWLRSSASQAGHSSPGGQASSLTTTSPHQQAHTCQTLC